MKERNHWRTQTQYILVNRLGVSYNLFNSSTVVRLSWCSAAWSVFDLLTNHYVRDGFRNENSTLDDLERHLPGQYLTTVRKNGYGWSILPPFAIFDVSVKVATVAVRHYMVGRPCRRLRSVTAARRFDVCSDAL